MHGWRISGWNVHGTRTIANSVIRSYSRQLVSQPPEFCLFLGDLSENFPVYKSPSFCLEPSRPSKYFIGLIVSHMLHFNQNNNV